MKNFYKTLVILTQVLRFQTLNFKGYNTLKF